MTVSAEFRKEHDDNIKSLKSQIGELALKNKEIQQLLGSCMKDFADQIALLKEEMFQLSSGLEEVSNYKCDCDEKIELLKKELRKEVKEIPQAKPSPKSEKSPTRM